MAENSNNWTVTTADYRGHKIIIFWAYQRTALATVYQVDSPLIYFKIEQLNVGIDELLRMCKKEIERKNPRGNENPDREKNYNRQ